MNRDLGRLVAVLFLGLGSFAAPGAVASASACVPIASAAVPVATAASGEPLGSATGSDVAVPAATLGQLTVVKDSGGGVSPTASFVVYRVAPGFHSVATGQVTGERVAEQVTDATGVARFELPQGHYLVTSAHTQPFLVSIPMADATGWSYLITAHPKDRLQVEVAHRVPTTTEPVRISPPELRSEPMRPVAGRGAMAVPRSGDGPGGATSSAPGQRALFIPLTRSGALGVALLLAAGGLGGASRAVRSRNRLAG